MLLAAMLLMAESIAASLSTSPPAPATDSVDHWLAGGRVSNVSTPLPDGPTEIGGGGVGVI
jgi:hypothetical protein